jgi:hypothetical protein
MKKCAFALAAAICVLGCELLEGGRGCTEIGCSDQVTLWFQEALAPGQWRFEITADSTQWTCTAAISTGGAAPTPECTGPEPSRVMFWPEGSSLSALSLQGTPAEVAVGVWRDDTLVLDDALSPAYEEVRPNGEGCEPVCRQAKLTLAFGG